MCCMVHHGQRWPKRALARPPLSPVRSRVWLGCSLVDNRPSPSALSHSCRLGEPTHTGLGRAGQLGQLARERPGLRVGPALRNQAVLLACTSWLLLLKVSKMRRTLAYLMLVHVQVQCAGLPAAATGQLLH